MSANQILKRSKSSPNITRKITQPKVQPKVQKQKIVRNRFDELPDDIQGLINDKVYIEYPKSPITFHEFFYKNNLYDPRYMGCIFILTGTNGNDIILYTGDGAGIYQFDKKRVDISNHILTHNRVHDTITKLVIKNDKSDILPLYKGRSSGGANSRKASVKKEICGRMRCIYKIQGSIKEHIKYKGSLITVADYKKLMKKA
jgi:hypothetical protein